MFKKAGVFVGLVILLNSFIAHGTVLEKIDESTFRYVMDNQLETILIENHAAPVISVIVTIKAGSRLETPELFGASHLLEHLLFNGTENRTQEQLYREMDEIGGYNNASTSEDYVNFIILSPKEHIEKAISIQSDMLFNSTLAADKFKKEKGIVIEEIAQSLNQISYARESIFKKFAYKQSPYSHDVLGSIPSITAMDRLQVMAFYKHYYVPNNMILMAIGDFDPDAFASLLDKYYGKTAGNSLDSPSAKIPHRFSEPAQYRFAFEDDRAYLKLAFPAPRYGSELFYPTLLLAEILSSEGEGGLLGQLEHRNDIFDLTCELDYHPDFSYFFISASHKPGADGKSITRDILSTLESMHSFLNEDKINGVALSLLTENEIYKERPHFYGMMKSQQLVMGGIEGLMNYEKFLKAVNAGPIHHSLDSLNAAPVKRFCYSPRIDSTKTDFGNSVKHLDKTLSNGLEIHVREEQGSDIFAVHVLGKNRALYETEYANGSVDMLHRLMAKGPTNMSPEVFNKTLEKIGARLKVSDNPYIPFDDYYFSPEYSTIRLECLNEHASRAVALLANMIKSPALNEGTLFAVKQAQKAFVARKTASASDMAMDLFWKNSSPGNPLSNPIMGDIQSISGITVDDLKALHEVYFSPQNLILTVVSSLKAETVMQDLLSHFDEYSKTDTITALGDYPQIVGVDSTITKTKTLGKMQSYIIAGNALTDIKAADLPALYALNAVLSARVSFQLREREGLAYRVGANIECYGNQALFYVYMGTRPQNLQRAITGIENEFKKLITNPADSSEIKIVVNQSRGRRLMKQLLSVGRAYLLGWGAFKYDDVDYYADFTQALAKVDEAQLRNTAKKYLPKALLICIAE